MMAQPYNPRVLMYSIVRYELHVEYVSCSCNGYVCFVRIVLSVMVHLICTFFQDEKNQIITTNCWLNQNWLDPKLKWDPIKYGNISVIMIPYEDVWKPDVVLYNK